MNKDLIINKIVKDLPVKEMRSQMSDVEWFGWFEEVWDKAINYTHCSTPLKRESKSFFNVKNLADLKRLYPNRDSYNADVCDGYIKYYVDKQLVITNALMV